MITIYFMRKKKTKDQAEIFREESRRNKMVVQQGGFDHLYSVLCTRVHMHCVLLLSCLSISNDQECYRTINREDMKILQDIYICVRGPHLLRKMKYKKNI